MRLAVCFVFSVAVLSLAGCSGPWGDPYQRNAIDWSAPGSPGEDIAEEAANKGDLIQGQSEPGSNGAIAVGGVEKTVTGGLATTLTPTSPGGTE